MASPLGLPSGIAHRLAEAPTSDFIYSSMSFLRERHGSRVPGPWFAAALGEIGVDPPTIRQTLFRLVKSGALVSTAEGRVNWYSPTPTTTTILDAGRARTTESVDDEWDGQWTLVHLRLDDSERKLRDRLRAILKVHGFGRLRSGVYIHPRDKTSLILDAMAAADAVDRIAVFRGARHGPPSDDALAHQLWDLDAIAKRYADFVRRYEPIAETPASDWSPIQAFALRFAYMFELFRITWDDPALPTRFLPSDWPGGDARRIAELVRSRVRPSALDFASEIADSVGMARVRSPARV